MQWHGSGECPVAVIIECHCMRVIVFVNNNKILITTTNTSNNKNNKNNIHARSAIKLCRKGSDYANGIISVGQ